MNIASGEILWQLGLSRIIILIIKEIMIIQFYILSFVSAVPREGSVLKPAKEQIKNLY